MEMVTEREGRRGQNGTGNGKRGGRSEQGGHQGPEKRRPLVEYVSEYQESYKGEVANSVRHLQHL